MSEWVYVWMAAFDRRDPMVRQHTKVGQYLHLYSVPALLDKSKSPKQSAAQPAGTLRFLDATVRNGHLQWKSKELFDAMGSVDSLRFMSQELYSYSDFFSSEQIGGCSRITSNERDQFKDCGFSGGGYDQYYVFDKTKYHDVIDDIDRLLKWSIEHPDKVATVFDWYSSHETREKVERDVIAEIENVQAMSIPEKDEARGDDGMSVEVGFDASGLGFAYRMLKTIRSLLEYANEAGLNAVYYNSQPNSGFEWWETMMRANSPVVMPPDVREDEMPEPEMRPSTRQKTYPTPDAQWSRTVKYIYEIYEWTPWEYWLERYKCKHRLNTPELTDDELQYLRVRWRQEQENGPTIHDDDHLGIVIRRHKWLLIGDIFVMCRNNGMHERYPALGVSSKGIKLKYYYLQFNRSSKGTERHVVVELVDLPDDLIGLRWDDPAVRRFVADLRATRMVAG